MIDLILVPKSRSIMPHLAHGGARVGAGRKPGSGTFREPTRPIRVPISQVCTVVSYLDACRHATVVKAPRGVLYALPQVSLTAFASRVPAGLPAAIADEIGEAINFHSELVIEGHEAETFVLRVNGWSMMNAGIFDGDRIVVDRALSPRQDDVVVAMLNNELTVKRLGTVDGKLALLPENPHFTPMLVDEGDDLTIWGVVTNCLRQFGRGRR